MDMKCEVCGNCFRTFKSRVERNRQNEAKNCCSKNCALLGNEYAGKWQKQTFQNTFLERFWSRVEKHDSGCWMWVGGKVASGYGVCRKNGKKMTVHRISYFIHYPDISTQFCILHKCDNKLCVNPDHLFAGTQLENIIDRDKKGRQAKGENSIHAKLTEADVLRIKELLAILTLSELSAMFKVSKFTISSIKNNRTWKHLNHPFKDD